jgi:hypothetical protein
VGVYLLIESPVQMVVLGAMAQSIMLPVFAFGTLWLHHRRLPPEVAPPRATTVILWAAALLIAAVMGTSLVMSILRV